MRPETHNENPRQWVCGSNGKTFPSLGDDEDLSAVSAGTTETKMAKKHALKLAARAAWYEPQSVRALTKALSHRARVEPRDYKPGDMVYIYRDDPSGKRAKAKWRPATIIGAEGSNYWAARGGRCLYYTITLRIKAAIREVDQAIDKEFADLVEDDADMPAETRSESTEAALSSRPEALPAPMEIEKGDRRRKAEAIEQKHKVMKKQARLLDDVPLTLKHGAAGRPKKSQQFYTKHGLTGPGEGLGQKSCRGI